VIPSHEHRKKDYLPIYQGGNNMYSNPKPLDISETRGKLLLLNALKSEEVWISGYLLDLV
jgi:hypothetical protein